MLAEQGKLLHTFVANQFSQFESDPIFSLGLKPRYTEEQRQAEYKKRGHTWPPKISPDTEGWKRILNQRFAQVRALDNSQQMWDGYIQTLSSALMQNYTEFGWGLTHAPEELTNEIRKAIFDGLPTARKEGDIDVIDGPIPLFIDRPDLTKRVRSKYASNGSNRLAILMFSGKLCRHTVSSNRFWKHGQESI